MTHYVCPKCGGVSETPKVCETEGCTHKDLPLQECNCTDGKHEEVEKE